MSDNWGLIMLLLVVVMYGLVLVETHGIKAMLSRYIKEDKDDR